MEEKNISIGKLYSRDKNEVITTLKKNGSFYMYSSMDDNWKQKFMDFCTGKTTLPLLYDTTIKRIFHPLVHKERLSDLISSIIGEKVKVKEVFPCEDSFIDGGKLVIMDIVVELANGSIADVEIQKSPYDFAGKRLSCYSSDLVLRQYSKIKGTRNKKFKYSDLRKVYTIVIYEKTGQAFHFLNDYYIHHGETTFNSGLKLDMLQNYYLVALDVFKEMAYHKDNSRLAGWLSLLVTEAASDVDLLIQTYPWLEEIYREIAEYRNNPAEVFNMYSNMLRELDHNSMQYLIDEQKEQINMLMEEKRELIAVTDSVIATKNNLIVEKDNTIAEKDNTIAEKDKEIARLKTLLNNK